jgi:hypothetical protein
MDWIGLEDSVNLCRRAGEGKSLLCSCERDEAVMWIGPIHSRFFTTRAKGDQTTPWRVAVRLHLLG